MYHSDCEHALALCQLPERALVLDDIVVLADDAQLRLVDGWTDVTVVPLLEAANCVLGWAIWESSAESASFVKDTMARRVHNCSH